MKFVICCLLAVCAFKAVFTDKLQDDVNKSRGTSTDDINKIVHRLLSVIKLQVKDARKNGVIMEGNHDCLENSIKSINAYSDLKLPDLDKCNDKAIKDKDIKYAESCFADTVGGFIDEAKIIHSDAKECIKNCVNMECSKY